MDQTSRAKEKQAIKIIENCWCCYRDKQMFKVLKQAISSADNSLSKDIMRKINPCEAEFLKDPIFQTKIRFRFSGEEFPPNIVFKVFIQTNGIGVKYLCGKKIIKPASQAAADSCMFMGNRKFLNQMLQDLCQQEQQGIEDETDISSMKDYMKYLSILDENSPESGGKANTWRNLTLDVVPRNHIISDVLFYLHHGTKTQQFLDHFHSSRAQEHLLPLSQTQQMEYIKLLHSRKNNEPSRRSKQARQRAAKMKRIYQNKMEDDEGYIRDEIQSTSTNKNINNGTNLVPVSPLLRNEEIDFDDEDWEEEAQLLFEWTKNLSLTNLAASR